MKRKVFFVILFFFLFSKLLFAATSVFYSISPFGTGDIKTGSPTITISSGIATLSVAQTGNIGVGCCIDFGAGPTLVYIAPNRLGFDSGGTTELKVNTKIEGGTSGATGIIRAIEVTSGTWAGGDAVGWIYFSVLRGTWQDDEQINRIEPSTSNNIATVDGVLNGNIGNGDTQFVVKTVTGSDAANVASAETINSIHHEYASLSAYEAGFTDASHINNSVLDPNGADVIAYACCFYDHDDQTLDTTPMTTNFGTTGPNNYVQFYVPNGNSESINNQRHDGKRNTNKYFLRTTTAWSNSLTLTESYLRFQGLQVENADANTFLYCFEGGGSESDIYYYEIESCIIVDGDQAAAKRGFSLTICATGTIIKIFNCIIYDFSDTGGTGILLSEEHATMYSYNNTIHNCAIAYDNVFKNDYGDFIIKNSIAQSCSNDINGGGFNANSTHSIYESAVSEGAFGIAHTTGTTTGAETNKLIDSGGELSEAQVGSIVANTTDTTYSYVTSVDSDEELTLNDDIFTSGENYSIYTNIYGAIVFEDETNDIFHLDGSDSVASSKGIDLSSDANLEIWDDVDGEERVVTWGIGADDAVSNAQIIIIGKY